MTPMRFSSTLRTFTPILMLLGICAAAPCISASAQTVPSRVIERVDDAKLVRLTGNTHPSARPKNDRGLVDPAKQLDRMMLVLKRSPEQEKDLAAFNERQYDPKSPDFHHWLSASEFGQLYGPAESDVVQITSWLQNHGFSIDRVSKGRVTIEFSGTVAQVQNAFHLEMHNYLVNGKMHISNDRDPSIPEALFPVITGVASLNDFFATRTRLPKSFIKRDWATGKYSRLKAESDAEAEPGAGSKFADKDPGVHPNFVFQNPNVNPSTYPDQVLVPYDIATIYNILPLWNESTPINGTGVSVAIVARSDVSTSDFDTFRSSFGLPAGTLTTIHDGPDPGLQLSDGDQGENTLDTEMVSATAPGAQVILVANGSTSTTDGGAISINQIIEDEVAPILTSSYLQCELILGTSGNTFYSNIYQQATTEGITPFVCADDAGSAGCTSQDGKPPYGDDYGLAVNGMASNPYVTGVGGSDLQWYLTGQPTDTYWNLTNNPTTGASAKGYMPESAWNTTCTNPLLLNVYTSYTTSEGLCNAAINPDPYLVTIASGGGGVSACTTNNGQDPSSCSGGYAKPSWQTGVPGIPNDGKRDVPDMVMFGSYGFSENTGLPVSALLICQSDETETGACNYTNPDYIVYEVSGGTSAATPMTAGVMAMVVQKTGSKQGLANPVLYSLAAKENYTSCNSNTVAAGNSCIFHDITTGSNAMNCYTGDTDCVTNTSGDSAGILSGYSAGVGYDLTTGLGSLNVANLVNAWPTTTTAPAITLSPTSLTFATTTVGSTTAAQVVTIKNTGTGAATLTSETVTGTDASSFVKSATTCGTTLAAAASCTVSVEFKPAAAGTLTASLSVADNATGTPQTVALTGTGAAAATYTLTATPTALTFASTTVGTTSATVGTVTLKNTGTGAVTLTSETITGTDATSFLKSATTCGTSLASGATCTVSVEFKPAAAGTLTASLSIADNATGTPQTVTLTGTGAAAATYTLTATPTALTFTSTTVGTTSAAVGTVTLKNTGTGAVTLTSETITGTDATSFLKSATTCGTSLASGATCTVSVEFKPAAAGTLTASLSIADNATGTPQTVALTGTGAAAATYTLTATPTALTFASTTVGTTSATVGTVTLKNTGTGAVTLTSETITGTDATSFLKSATTCGTSLASGATCTVSVEFKPAAAGTLTASLSIADNATGTPQTVALTGTGAAATTPTVTLTPSTIAFTNTIVGSTSDAQIVTLKNTGTVTVTLTSIVMGGANATSFPELNNCGATLAAAASCSIFIAFDPASAAALTGTLSVTDSATGSPQKVTLTGTGTVAPSVKLNVTSIAFPATTHATTSEAVPVTLTNSGTATLDLTSIALTGTNPTDFVVFNTCAATLAPAATCTVYVAFQPATAAAFTAKLTITDNGSASPQSVTLTGTGK